MTRRMVDSTNINDEPAADLVLYYCDGDFAVSEATVRARFPKAILVPCSAVGTNSGTVGDCEPGCMTEDQLVTWVVERRAAGVDPTGYVNEMHGWAPARAAFAAHGVPEPHWGVADYDDVGIIPPGAVFKQDKNSALTGGHFDESVVVDFWPGVDNAAGGVEGVDDMTNPLSETLIWRLCAFAGIIAQNAKAPDGEPMAAYFAAGAADRAREDAILKAVTTVGSGGQLTAAEQTELDQIAADAAATRAQLAKDLAP